MTNKNTTINTKATGTHKAGTRPPVLKTTDDRHATTNKAMARMFAEYGETLRRLARE